jgi:hypothetical protein
MINLSPTVNEDLDRIKTWQAADIDEAHRIINPTWWLTGALGSYLAGRAEDSEGIVLYFRFDKETPDTLRMYTQFGPEEIVSRRRVAAVIAGVLPPYIRSVQAVGIQAIIFETIFPELAAFCTKTLGFEHVEKSNDYILKFAAEAVAVTE